MPDLQTWGFTDPWLTPNHYHYHADAVLLNATATTTSYATTTTAAATTTTYAAAAAAAAAAKLGAGEARAGVLMLPLPSISHPRAVRKFWGVGGGKRMKRRNDVQRHADHIITRRSCLRQHSATQQPPPTPCWPPWGRARAVLVIISTVSSDGSLMQPHVSGHLAIVCHLAAWEHPLSKLRPAHA